MTTEPNSPSSPRLRRALLPALVAAALVIPNLIVVALGVEDFPFTVAPMFAHHVGPETELYSFRFEGVRDGVAGPLALEETNLHVRNLQRQMVAWFYRPMTGTSPLRDLAGGPADREAFEARMAEFFAPIIDFLADERSVTYDSVALYADRSDTAGTVLESDLVGTYDPSTRAYTHLIGRDR